MTDRVITQKDLEAILRIVEKNYADHELKMLREDKRMVAAYSRLLCDFTHNFSVAVNNYFIHNHSND